MNTAPHPARRSRDGHHRPAGATHGLPATGEPGTRSPVAPRRKGSGLWADADTGIATSPPALTDAQFSVVAILGPGVSAPADRIGYSPYGIATFRTAADVDGYGGADINDATTVSSYKGIGTANTAYNADYDMNRDGVIDAADADFVYNQEGEGSAVQAGWLGDNRAASGGPRLDIGYCGYVFNEETSLYTVRFRNYSPLLGRWLERDPAGYVDGASLYQYVKSSPVRSFDPLGLATCQECAPEFPPCTEMMEGLDKIKAVDGAVGNACSKVPSIDDLVSPVTPLLETLASSGAEECSNQAKSLAAGQRFIFAKDLTLLTKHFHGQILGQISDKLAGNLKSARAWTRMGKFCGVAGNGFSVKDMILSLHEGDYPMAISSGCEIAIQAFGPVGKAAGVVASAAKQVMLVNAEIGLNAGYQEMNGRSNCEYLQGVRQQIVSQFHDARVRCNIYRAVVTVLKSVPRS